MATSDLETDGVVDAAFKRFLERLYVRAVGVTARGHQPLESFEHRCLSTERTLFEHANKEGASIQ